MNTALSQQEFEEMDGIVVHLVIDGSDPPRSLCLGEIIDTQRWADSRSVRKQCQHCRAAAMREMRK